ncbi:hypothetical protein PCANC_24045 [Puccinia coronata f. sp. avenae]|uniref:Uncharacterized protein n=1 Tax=Puccinia coronata f. sp. avenae TaxID=200324 RepID=A0A2N5S3Y5_9BASI|nr:hypothetical protein PCANC_24045 [Puccinia coronata f. sp. avenae]
MHLGPPRATSSGRSLGADEVRLISDFEYDELNKVPLGLGWAPGPRQRTAGLKLSLPEGQGFELSILLPSRKRS